MSTWVLPKRPLLEAGGNAPPSANERDPTASSDWPPAGPVDPCTTPAEARRPSAHRHMSPVMSLPEEADDSLCVLFITIPASYKLHCLGGGLPLSGEPLRPLPQHIVLRIRPAVQIPLPVYKNKMFEGLESEPRPDGVLSTSDSPRNTRKSARGLNHLTRGPFRGPCRPLRAGSGAG